MEIKISSRMLGHIYDDGGLRDWFAGMALQGLIAGTGNAQRNIQREAMEAYFYADAMLEARKETK